MRISIIALAAATLSACGASSSNSSNGSASPNPAPTGGSDPTEEWIEPVTRGAQVARGDAPFAIEAMGSYDEPWAAEFMPGTQMLFITGKGGEVWFKDVATGRSGSIESGLPTVDYGGQGGLGDIAFAPDFSGTSGTLYLSWVEAGPGDTRGAVVGRGQLACDQADSCALSGLEVLWRQDKTTGRGHYSHRLHFSPDGQYLFVSSGDRQKQDPAQDVSNNLGAVLRLTLDGQAAPGNPFYDRGGSTAQIWSYGHRNTLGIDFAPDGRLWQSEMGPKHGDELNLIERGLNYGWPEASFGDNYNGVPIADHRPGDGYEEPDAYWVPAISPASLLIYSGDLFGEWTGDAILPGLSGQELSVVEIDGDEAKSMTSYAMGARIREIVEGPEGAIYLLEDDRNGSEGRLLKLTPKG